MGNRTDTSVRRLNQSAMGFTLLETMIAVAIIGILVNLAVPIYSEARLRAQVAAIVADARVVRTAAADYYLTHHEWPADTAAGITPPELGDYLGDQINWSSPYTYDYDYFADAEGNPTQPEAGVLVGFSIRNIDARLKALIEASEPGDITETWGNGVTFVIQPAEPEGDSSDTSDADVSDSDPDGSGGNGRGRGRGRGND